MPPTTVTLEFGGVTGFHGVEATLIGVVVPEPCGIALLALAAWRP